MNRVLTTRKLFIAFTILGLFNVILAYSFFYFSSVSLLEKRSFQQMTSVRALASQKLKLYLDNLKINSVQRVPEALQGRPFQNEYEIIDFQDRRFSEFRPLAFHLSDEKILIKIPMGRKFIVWKYNIENLNEVLSEHAGLGKTGEIYLVGHDQKIKSASRHLRDWKNITVHNESVKAVKHGKSGVHVVRDYRNVKVVSAYSPFAYDELKLILLSEMDEAEVFLPMRDLFPKIFLICFILCIISTLLAYYSSAKILELIRDMKRHINDLNIQFMNAMEEHNRSISVNLHDGVGQILTAIKWGISRNENQEKLKSLCDEAFRETRSVSSNLMPTELSELGFYAAVKNFFRDQEAYYKISTNFWYNESLEQYKFKDGLEVNLYRIVQELFQNTLKHAHALAVSLVIFKEGDNLTIRYEDDGIGMAENVLMPRVLQYRADLMGANIIRTKTPKGLVFQIQIPLKSIFSEKI